MSDAAPIWKRLLLGVPLYGWLLVLVIAPNLLLLIASFRPSEGGAMLPGFDLGNYSRILARPSYPILIGQTLLTAILAAAMACLIAYPMAYIVSRRASRYKLLFVMLVIIPLWVSLLMRVFAWKIILGENGVLNSFLVWSGFLAEPTQLLLYTRFTVFLTFTYVAIPYVFVTTFTALERIPNSLIEAARDCGASPAYMFRRIVWPLSRQGLMIGFALAFLLSVGDYVSPAMVGGLNGTMIGMIIASQFGLAGNWPFGAALAVVLMVGVLAVLFVALLLGRARGVIEASGGGTTADFLPWNKLSAGGKLAQTGGLVAFGLCFVLLYGPLAVIVLFSFNGSTLQALPLAGFSLEWYTALLSDEPLLAALKRSMLVGLVVSILSAAFGTALALMFARLRLPGGKIAESLVVLPVMLPGIVLGISLALTFSSLGLDSGFWTVVLGQMTFTVPVVMVVVGSRLRGQDPALEHASSDLGATRWMTFRRITLPLIQSAILAGTLLGFTMSFDEVTVTLFLTGAEPTLPVYIWNQLRFGFTPTINAVFALIGLVSLALIVTATWLMNRSRNGRASVAVAGAT